MDNPWVLPVSVIVEGDVCDICDETAMPYDAADQVGYCPEHQMAWETDQALEDYTEQDADDQHRYLLSRLNWRVTDKGICCILGCRHDGLTRLAQDDVVPLIVCTGCAADVYLGDILLDRETWVQLLTDEIIDPY